MAGRFVSGGAMARALLLAVSAPIALAAIPAAQAQTQTTGRNVTAVMVDAGPNAQYVKQSRDTWSELDSRGRPIFQFRERSRDDWSVYLVDAGRGIEIQLDLHRRKVTISERGGPRRDLYTITRFTHQGRNYPAGDVRDRDSRDGPGRRDDWRDGRDDGRGGGRDRDDDRGGRGGDTRPVDAGPIWNQRDADTKCRALADRMRGEWTGGWWTTQPGRMSVCEIRSWGGRDDRDRDGRGRDDRGGRGRDVVRNIEVGPIWNQRDAETKCRAEAVKLRAEWTGQWRTTAAGRMSECEIRFR